MTAPPKAPAIPLPATIGTSLALGGGFDAYARLLKGSKPGGRDAETRPLAKGEFTTLIGKLTGEKKAQLQKAIVVFKQLAEELPKTREGLDESSESVESRSEIEINRAAKTVLIALRRDEVNTELIESIKLQLYNAALMASDFKRAISLYPRLKAMVGGRMKGIYALSEQRRETILKHELLTDFFIKTPNVRDGLLQIFRDSSMTTDTPNPAFSAPLYNLGTLLPIYYLLASCADVTGGLCGNCNATTEDRLRAILPELKGVQKGLLGRLCDFASTFA